MHSYDKAAHAVYRAAILSRDAVIAEEKASGAADRRRIIAANAVVEQASDAYHFSHTAR